MQFKIVWTLIVTGLIAVCSGIFWAILQIKDGFPPISLYTVWGIMVLICLIWIYDIWKGVIK